MNSAKTLRNILLACGLGSAIASGCVITTGSVDCEVCNDSPLCHNHTAVNSNTGSEECYCDAGYSWEDPNDPTNLECERIPSKPGASNCVEPNSVLKGDQCYCDSGYTWCNPDSQSDLTCCLDDAQDAAGSSDTDDSAGSDSQTATTEAETDSAGTATDSETDTSETSESTTGQNEPPPDSECTQEGLRACSNTDAGNVEGSTAWTCTAGGTWEELDLDGDCQFDGSDFAYGCYDDGTNVVIECGSGPGTPCTEADDACSDADLLQICLWGKLTDVSCSAACTDPEAEVTWETGECVEGMAFCQCCDDPVDGACACDGGSTCEGQ